jgi:hypothetical protein
LFYCCSIIINKPERKLKKGTGYNIDMLIVGGMPLIAGVIGLPFLSVATVR